MNATDQTSGHAEPAPVPALAVLHQDAELLVLAKPAGIAVIPGRGEADATCLRAAAERSIGRRLWVVHRLDRDVSGVLALARTAAEHRRLSLAFERGEVGKRYLALVDGRVAEDRGEVDLPLRTGGHGGRTVVDRGRGKPARTGFEVLERFARFSWLALEPRTGRTHQLRVHLRALGHSLAVDRRYGARAELTAAELEGRERAAGEPVLVAQATLHGAWLSLPGSGARPPIAIEAPLPADLAAVLARLREARA